MTTPSPSRNAATTIVRLLQAQGHVAYFAGGCVRDALMGLPPKDYDIATDAHPKQVATIFRNTQFVGEAFGITLVRLKGCAIEVATFRSESGYHDRRRPSHVIFTNAQQDAIRRDFTINGLFENPLATNPADRIIDYVGGRSDIQARILRAIGQPEARLGEDYLRMLRAIRFASRFDLRIEDETARAIAMHAKHLADISRERIGQELQWMLTPAQEADDAGKRILKAVHLLELFHLDSPVLDEPHVDAPPRLLKAMLEKVDVASLNYPALLTGWVIDRALAAADAPPMVSSGWLTDWVESHAPTIVARLRRALVLSNEQTDAIKASLTAMAKATAWSDMSVAKRKRLLGCEGWAMARPLLEAMPADASLAGVCQVIRRDAPGLEKTGIRPGPLVNGADLISLGQKPGPALGRLLEQAYDAQLQGLISTHEQAVAWLRQALNVQDADS